jgi:hypothetical protein
VLSASKKSQTNNRKRKKQHAKQHGNINQRRDARNQNHHQLAHSLDAANESENANRVEGDEVARHSTAAQIVGNCVHAKSDENGKHVDQPERVGTSSREAVREECDAELDAKVENQDAIGEKEHEGPDFGDRIGEAMARNAGLGDDGWDDVEENQNRRGSKIPRIGDDTDRATTDWMIGGEVEEGSPAKTAIADVDRAGLRCVEVRHLSETHARFGECFPDEDFSLPLDDD